MDTALQSMLWVSIKMLMLMATVTVTVTGIGSPLRGIDRSSPGKYRLIAAQGSCSGLLSSVDSECWAVGMAG
ncbi:MAG: hypothetical protein F6K16_32055 [Symploca sp. SIO2B6]|nr:hypothetical protein [Symploca sp. SIO2B6]